jgi:hypothetical protein
MMVRLYHHGSIRFQPPLVSFIALLGGLFAPRTSQASLVGCACPALPGFWITSQRYKIVQPPASPATA